MGAGKSRIGPLLAELMNCPFYDTDKLIEKSVGKKIAKIFKDEGEAFFRKLESEKIIELAAKKDKAVISLGGGALTYPQNKTLAEKAGIVVYLNSSAEVIFNRVKHTKKRPLLNVPRDENFEENLLKRIKELLDARKEIYESAHIIVQRDNHEPSEIAETIRREILKYENNKR